MIVFPNWKGEGRDKMVKFRNVPEDAPSREGAWMNMYMCACGGPQLMSGIFLHLLFIFIFETRSLPECKLHHFS